MSFSGTSSLLPLPKPSLSFPSSSSSASSSTSFPSSYPSSSSLKRKSTYDLHSQFQSQSQNPLNHIKFSSISSSNPNTSTSPSFAQLLSTPNPFHVGDAIADPDLDIQIYTPAQAALLVDNSVEEVSRMLEEVGKGGKDTMRGVARSFTMVLGTPSEELLANEESDAELEARARRQGTVAVGPGMVVPDRMENGTDDRFDDLGKCQMGGVVPVVQASNAALLVLEGISQNCLLSTSSFSSSSSLPHLPSSNVTVGSRTSKQNAPPNPIRPFLPATSPQNIKASSSLAFIPMHSVTPSFQAETWAWVRGLVFTLVTEVQVLTPAQAISFYQRKDGLEKWRKLENGTPIIPISSIASIYRHPTLHAAVIVVLYLISKVTGVVWLIGRSLKESGLFNAAYLVWGRNWSVGECAALNSTLDAASYIRPRAKWEQRKNDKIIKAVHYAAAQLTNDSNHQHYLNALYTQYNDLSSLARVASVSPSRKLLESNEVGLQGCRAGLTRTLLHLSDRSRTDLASPVSDKTKLPTPDTLKTFKTCNGIVISESEEVVFETSSSPLHLADCEGKLLELPETRYTIMMTTSKTLACSLARAGTTECVSESDISLPIPKYQIMLDIMGLATPKPSTCMISNTTGWFYEKFSAIQPRPRYAVVFIDTVIDGKIYGIHAMALSQNCDPAVFKVIGMFNGLHAASRTMTNTSHRPSTMNVPKGQIVPLGMVVNPASTTNTSTTIIDRRSSKTSSSSGFPSKTPLTPHTQPVNPVSPEKKFTAAEVLAKYMESLPEEWKDSVMEVGLWIIRESLLSARNTTLLKILKGPLGNRLEGCLRSLGYHTYGLGLDQIVKFAYASVSSSDIAAIVKRNNIEVETYFKEVVYMMSSSGNGGSGLGSSEGYRRGEQRLLEKLKEEDDAKSPSKAYHRDLLSMTPTQIRSRYVSNSDSSRDFTSPETHSPISDPPTPSPNSKRRKLRTNGL